jgi:hypothetical protein
MKIKLIAVCPLFVTLIATEPTFAQEKGKSGKQAKPAMAASVAARRVESHHSSNQPLIHSSPRAVRSAPPKHPWVGRNVAISESERDVIRAYVRNRIQASKGGKFNGVPQGLVKKNAAWGNKLPSGWQEKCVRGEVLSSEVHKHCHSLPDDIIVKLPPPPPGTVLLAVGGKVVRVAYPTYEILDLFDVL